MILISIIVVIKMMYLYGEYAPNCIIQNKNSSRRMCNAFTISDVCVRLKKNMRTKTKMKISFMGIEISAAVYVYKESISTTNTQANKRTQNKFRYNLFLYFTDFE